MSIEDRLNANMRTIGATIAKEAREDHGLANALAWFQSIKEMVDALEKAQASDIEINSDDEVVTIQQSVLSVEVRSGWYSPAGGNADSAPAEYRILMSTGGPACQLVGELDAHGEPETARLQAQDWFKPWEDVPVGNIAETHFLKIYVDDVSAAYDAVRETLLTFARQFYFGEG